MSSKVTEINNTTQQQFLSPKGKPLTKRLWKDRWLYIFLLPGIVYFAVYKYLPMWGVLMSFQNYQPHLGNMEQSVGWVQTL